MSKDKTPEEEVKKVAALIEEAPKEETPVEPTEEVSEPEVEKTEDVEEDVQVDEDEPEQLNVRHAVVHVNGERVTLGDGVAEEIARGELPEAIYLPSAGKEVPTEEFTWESDGKPVE